MANVQKTSTAQWKREAVQVAQSSGKSIVQVGRDLGSSETRVQKFRKQLAEQAPHALPESRASEGHGRGKSSPQTRKRRVPSGARQLQKSSGHLLVRPAVREHLLAQHQHEECITTMCRMLEGSEGGYDPGGEAHPGSTAEMMPTEAKPYNWLSRPIDRSMAVQGFRRNGRTKASVVRSPRLARLLRE